MKMEDSAGPRDLGESSKGIKRRLTSQGVNGRMRETLNMEPGKPATVPCNPQTIGVHLSWPMAGPLRRKRIHLLPEEARGSSLSGSRPAPPPPGSGDQWRGDQHLPSLSEIQGPQGHPHVSLQPGGPASFQHSLATARGLSGSLTQVSASFITDVSLQ